MLLKCRNISFKYPKAETDVFRNLTFDIQGPGFHSFFGPSGVGKTSFARIISGDIVTFEGELETAAVDTILYCYNLERLPGWSSVGDHLNKVTPKATASGMDELIHTFGVQDVLDMRFSQLSLGQQNRVNLIRYLLQDFNILIMDESLANVDEKTREKIILKIKEMFPDKCFLYISHNIIEVSRFCKTILVFRNAHKIPQVCPVEGRDQRSTTVIAKADLEKTMLEIMNAS